MTKLNKYLTLALMLCLSFVGANAQTWDFTEQMGEADLANITADVTGWTPAITTSQERYSLNTIITKQALTANGVELDFTKGLLFTNSAKDQIRIDNGKRFILNNTKATITIPNLSKDDIITVVGTSSNKTTERTVKVSNATVVSGFEATTSEKTQTNIAKVDADGEVEITPDGGFYIFEISIKKPGEETGSGDVTTLYNESMNINKNQMYVHLSNGDVKYYGTENLRSVDLSDSQVSVNANAGSDIFTGAIGSIDFRKAVDQGEGGEVDNPAGKVEIIEAKGWLESAYVTWKPFDGAKTYNVYVKGGQYADYTKIDYQLVRNYGTYGRADVVGLRAASDYVLKVVPVNADKEEIASAANEATKINVNNYDRSGFAHHNYPQGVGAYKNDGTLKDNAVVLYITNDNFSTIQCDITTGKNKETRTGVGDILAAFEKGAETRPFVFRFIGKVNAVQAQLVGEKHSLQIKGKGESSTMNITFEGIGEDATWYGWGMTITKCASVEVRNIATMLFEDDGIQLKEGYHTWIHNVDIFYGGTGSDSDQAKGDGSLDTKDSGSWNTYSYNHFWDSGKCSLCGMKSENTDDVETYHHNWFDHSDSRHPRVRTKTIHVYNNYYDGVSKYGVGATMGSSVFVENNYFRHSHNPMLISKQGTDAKGNGTFSGENGGMIKSFGNIYAEKGSTQYTPITHKDSATDFDCYEADSRDEQVPASFKTKAGGTTYNNFDTGSSMYEYTPDATADVPVSVMGWYGAGRMNHGDFLWTFDNATEDTNYGVIAALKTALQNYKSKLVGIYDGENSSTGGDTPTDPTDPTEPTEPSEPSDPVGGGVISAPTYCHFTGKTCSNKSFTVSGNYANTKGSATVNGVTYTDFLKIESATSIKFETDKEMTMTLYFSNTDSKASIKVNGTAVSGDTATHTLTTTVNGAIELTKKDTVNLFYIDLK